MSPSANRQLGAQVSAMWLQLVQRRAVALLAAAAAISKSSQPSRADSAPQYSLELPTGFVRLGNLGSRSSASGYLLVAGDFRDTIGAGSATTSACDACVSHCLSALTQTNHGAAVSVQLIKRQALPPLPGTDAAGLAAALAQSRDKDTTNFEPSTVLVDTLTRLDSAEVEQAPLPELGARPLDTGSCLRFEMLTSLVGGGGAASADPSLVRHTLVQVTEASPWGCLLFAGAILPTATLPQSSPPRPAPLPGAGASRRPPCPLGNTTRQRRGLRVGHDVAASRLPVGTEPGLAARVPRASPRRPSSAQLPATRALLNCCHSGRGSTVRLVVGHRRSAEKRRSDLCCSSGTIVLIR